MPIGDLRNDHNCIAAPLAIEICTPTWADSERLQIIQWQAGLVVDIDPVIVHPETCPVGEDFTREYDRAEACEAELGPQTELLATVTAERDQARLTVAHLRGELRECRRDLSESLAGPQAAGMVTVALVLVLAAWRVLK